MTRPSWWRAASTGACRAPTCSRSRRTSATRRAPDRGRRPPPSQRPTPPPVGAARWTRLLPGPRPRPTTRPVRSSPAASPPCVAGPERRRQVCRTALAFGCIRLQHQHNGALPRRPRTPRGPPRRTGPARLKGRISPRCPVRRGRRGPTHPRRCTGRCLAAVRSSDPDSVQSRQARTTVRRHPRCARAAECVALRRFPTRSPTIQRVATSCPRGPREHRNALAGRRPPSCPRPGRSAAAWPRSRPDSPPRSPTPCSTADPATALRRLPPPRRPCRPECRPGHRRGLEGAPHESRFRRIPATSRAIRRSRSNRMRRGSCRWARAG